MDIDRPHRTATTTPTTSELLICLTSHLSHSSSMRISSKSILSPGRAGEKPTGSNIGNHSLTTSLSRRLRHSGSLRGGAGGGSSVVAQSPSIMLNKKGRGGGSGFDNPEPSSPKVTCIGQVRVKTKKQGKKMKMRACRSKSKRLSAGGSEASFRRFDGGGLTPQNSLGGSNNNQDRNLRNQRWVHLPVTICDAIRAFGNEFSCLIPCKSSCFSSNQRGYNGGNGDDCERSDGYGACGAVCRWLVAVQDGEEDRGRRDIELVVGDAEERVECSRRRSIFDDMEFNDEVFDVKNGGEVSGGRVSICVPPKNALLLMRCRSDPMKVSALSQKIWEAPVVDIDSEEDGEDDKVIDKVGDYEDVREVCVEGEKCGEVDQTCEDVNEVCLKDEKRGEVDEIREDVSVDEENGDECEMEGYGLDIFNEEVETEELMEGGEDKRAEECEEGGVLGEQKLENGDGEVEVGLIEQEAKEGEEISKESNELSCISSVTSVEESTAESIQKNDQVDKQENDQELIKSVHDDQVEEEETLLDGQSHQDMTDQEVENKSKWEEEPVQKQDKEKDNKRPVLPDCLLLMMCEPKLSMEVSKETWVCSTDFIRWLPERHQNKKSTKNDSSDEPKKKKSSGVAPVQPVKPVVQVQGPVQPGRSSISFPMGGGPVGKIVEPKLVKPGGGGGGGIEPFVLTRCKSAPMRSAGKNGPPELPCSLWRRESSRKIEPHRASFGATGVGF